MFTLRFAADGDSIGILDCLRTAFEPYRLAYTPDAFEHTVLTAATLRHRLASMRVLVATSAADEVVGTISWNRTDGVTGHIRGMAVLPTWHGRGVAAGLLRRAEFELKDEGCRRITLGTTAVLTRAIEFYERRGFVASGRTTDFFGMALLEFAKGVPTPTAADSPAD